MLVDGTPASRQGSVIVYGLDRTCILQALRRPAAFVGASRPLAGLGRRTRARLSVRFEPQRERRPRKRGPPLSR